MKCALDGVEQVGAIQRFIQKIGGAAFERSTPRFNIVVSGYEDYRQGRTLRDDPSLKVEPIHPRHANVRDDAIRLFENAGFQKFPCRAEDARMMPGRFQQGFKRLPDGDIIVNNCYSLFLQKPPTVE